MARCDLHLHSRHSVTPPGWLQRRAGLLDSYSDPAALRRACRSAGMDFFTLTDHDTLAGCDELAGEPGVFPGEELTVHFPDGVRAHLLVWGHSAAQHDALHERARDPGALRDYLAAEQLAHAVAHPLCPVDPGFTVDHFERLLLWFDCFETVNGQRTPLTAEVTRACLAALTPERMAALADRHDIAPSSPGAWRKRETGGSNDHAGLFPARAFTETPATTVQAFLEHLRTGHPVPGGEAAHSPVVASTLYGNLYHFARHHLQRRAPLYARFLERIAERFLAGKHPTTFSFGEKVELAVDAVRSGGVFQLLKPGNAFARDLAQFFNQPALQRRIESALRTEPTAERRSFAMACEISNHLGFRFFDQMVRQGHANDFLGSLQSAAALAPVAASVAPYLLAFQYGGSNRPLLESAARYLTPRPPAGLLNEKRAWLTDTLEDINGVARTIRSMTRAARAQGHDLTIITSRTAVDDPGDMVLNFQPVGEFELPEYKLQKLSFPPVLQMIDHLERGGYTELILSTPGPVGMTGLLAARLLGLRTSGIYHTDFPQYIKILCEDSVMETLTWGYMHWFYGQVDVLYSNTRFYADQWRARGIPAEKLRILPRGLDTELFHPGRRDAAFWKRRGARGPVALYVGRVSREKNLDLLPGIARELQRDGITVAVVGDGPFRDELARLAPNILFTGILSGDDLGAAYASADVFLFPSTTDTYGNVVVEAAACGLPSVVSSLGGPSELLRQGLPGRIVEAQTPSGYATAVREVLRAFPAPCPVPSSIGGWDRAADAFWKATETTAG